jgi:hypothetical protein
MKKKIKKYFAIFLCIFVITNAVVVSKADAAALPIITVGALLLAVVAIVATNNGVKLDINDKEGLTAYAYMYFNEHAQSDDTFRSWWQDIKNKSYDVTVLGLSLAAVTSEQLKSMFNYTISTVALAQCVLSVHIRSVIVEMIKAYYGYIALVSGNVTQTATSKVLNYVENLTGITATSYSTVFTYPYVTVLKYNLNPYASRLYIVGSNTMPDITLISNDTSLSIEFSKNSYLQSFTATDQAESSWTLNTGMLVNSSEQIMGYPTLYYPNDHIIHYTFQSFNMTKERLLGVFKIANYKVDISSSITGSLLYTIAAAASYSYSIAASAYAIDDLDEAEQPIPISLWLNDYFETALKNTNIDNVAESTNTDAIVNAIDKGNIAAVREGAKVIDAGITDAIPKPITRANEWYDVILNPLKDLAKWLFVPSTAAVNEFVTTAQAKVEDGSNIFTYPLELVVRFLMGVAALGQSDCILHFPRVEFKGYVLYGGYSFNFTEYVHDSKFNQVYTIYIFFTDVVLVVAVLGLGIRKWDEFMTGGMSS